MDKLLTVGQVAKQLGVSVDVIRSLTESGALKAVRTGGGHRRYRAEDVQSYRDKTRGAKARSKPEKGQVSRLSTSLAYQLAGSRADTPASRPTGTPSSSKA